MTDEVGQLVAPLILGIVLNKQAFNDYTLLNLLVQD